MRGDINIFGAELDLSGEHWVESNQLEYYSSFGAGIRIDSFVDRVCSQGKCFPFSLTHTREVPGVTRGSCTRVLECLGKESSSN